MIDTRLNLPVAQKPVPVARARLQLSTAPRPVAAPISQARDSHLYDETWVDKQEKAFTRWLNHELTGTSFLDGGKKGVDGWSRRKERDRVRDIVMAMYQGGGMRDVVERLDKVSVVSDSMTFTDWMLISMLELGFVAERLHFPSRPDASL